MPQRQNETHKILPPQQPVSTFSASHAKNLHIDLGGGVFNAGESTLSAEGLHLDLVVSNQGDYNFVHDLTDAPDPIDHILNGKNYVAIQLGDTGSFTRISTISGPMTIDGNTFSDSTLVSKLSNERPGNIGMGDSLVQTTNSVGIKLGGDVSLSGAISNKLSNGTSLDWIEGKTIKVANSASFDNDTTLVASGDLTKVANASNIGGVKHPIFMLGFMSPMAQVCRPARARI